MTLSKTAHLKCKMSGKWLGDPEKLWRVAIWRTFALWASLPPPFKPATEQAEVSSRNWRAIQQQSHGSLGLWPNLSDSLLRVGHSGSRSWRWVRTRQRGQQGTFDLGGGLWGRDETGGARWCCWLTSGRQAGVNGCRISGVGRSGGLLPILSLRLPPSLLWLQLHPPSKSLPTTQSILNPPSEL